MWYTHFQISHSRKKSTWLFKYYLYYCQSKESSQLYFMNIFLSKKQNVQEQGDFKSKTDMKLRHVIAGWLIT